MNPPSVLATSVAAATLAVSGGMFLAVPAKAGSAKAAATATACGAKQSDWTGGDHGAAWAGNLDATSTTFLFNAVFKDNRPLTTVYNPNKDLEGGTNAAVPTMTKSPSKSVDFADGSLSWTALDEKGSAGTFTLFKPVCATGASAVKTALLKASRSTGPKKSITVAHGTADRHQ